MSNKYLVTLVSDKCKALKNMIMKLRKQDAEYSKWQDVYLDNLCNALDMLQTHAIARREELIKADGCDPEEFKI